MVRRVSVTGAVRSTDPSFSGSDYVHCRDITRAAHNNSPRSFYLSSLGVLKRRVEAAHFHEDSYIKAAVDYDWEAPIQRFCIETATKVITKFVIDADGAGDWFYFLYALVQHIWLREQAYTPRPPGSGWRVTLKKTTHPLMPVFKIHLCREVGLQLYRIMFRTVT